MRLPRLIGFCLAAALLGAWAWPAAAQGPTDEIQVYDAAIAPQGKFNLTFHSNFTPRGQSAPAYPGALISNHSLDGAFEWAYGYQPWLELGLYLPLYTLTSNRGPAINGGKLRALFVSPHAEERGFFYGMNFEFSYNAHHWDARHYSSEIRPIVGIHLFRDAKHALPKWDFIYNPILDNSWAGGFKSLAFNPAGRVAYHLNPSWAIAAEQYSGFGQLRAFLPGHDQVQQSWAVMDHYGAGERGLNIEAGIGFGETAASDKLTLKLMFSRNLN